MEGPDSPDPPLAMRLNYRYCLITESMAGMMELAQAAEATSTEDETGKRM